MAFYWLAKTSDGSVMTETSHRYSDILGNATLAAFAIVNKETDSPVLVLNLTPSKRLFYRRRTWVNTKGESTVIYIAGWTDEAGSRAVFAVFGDGHVEASSSFDQRHPYLYPIEFMPEEK